MDTRWMNRIAVGALISASLFSGCRSGETTPPSDLGGSRPHRSEGTGNPPVIPREPSAQNPNTAPRQPNAPTTDSTATGMTSGSPNAGGTGTAGTGGSGTGSSGTRAAAESGGTGGSEVERRAGGPATQVSGRADGGERNR
jgi:hypothetical protein